MLRLFIAISLSWCGLAQAKISTQCSACLKECPHDTKILLECDTGCQESCGKGEKDEYFSSIWVPAGCSACMSECPHMTKDFKACDRGCPDSCSRAQAAAFKAVKSKEAKSGDCYSCMSECPHVTRDRKACDAGCPDSCTNDGMRKAFLKANEKLQSCTQAQSDDESDGSAQ